MRNLPAEAFVRVLNTEPVTLVVQNTGEEFKVTKGMLALHSTFFAKLLSKLGSMEATHGRIEVSAPRDSVQLFVCWCYKQQLELPDTATNEQLPKIKVMLIDLWIFADKYGIGELQNLTMAALCEHLGKYPSLLNRDDVHIILDCTTNSSAALRKLATIVSVVQLEQDEFTRKPADYEEFAQGFQGFFSMMYQWQRAWIWYEGNQRIRKKTVLEQFLAERNVNKMLTVPEPEPEPWVLKMCGIGAMKPLVSGELIELD